MSLPILIDGFPHNSYLPFAFLLRHKVALCYFVPGLDSGHSGEMLQFWDAKQKLGSITTEFHLPCWFVNFTYWGESPLFSTYFLFRSDTSCLLFQPILISHPLSFAPFDSPYNFPLSTPSSLLTHSQSKTISMVACVRSLRKPSAKMSPLEQIPHLGIRIPSVLFPSFSKACLSTYIPSL